VDKRVEKGSDLPDDPAEKLVLNRVAQKRGRIRQFIEKQDRFYVMNVA
jgi:hypothetical protein